MISKFYCKISVSFGSVQNLEISGSAMAKVDKSQYHSSLILLLYPLGELGWLVNGKRPALGELYECSAANIDYVMSS
jgi:hypothetical protein